MAAVLLATLLAGCVGGGGGDDPGTLRAQAQAALARWSDAVAAAGGASSVVPVGELTRQVGDWELNVGDNNKPALMAGLVDPGGKLPAGTPPDAVVTWPDGTTATVPVMSAEQAVAAIRTVPADARCDDCTPLRIVGAELTTGQIDTSRGPATGPLWQFTIAGTAVKVSRVAIANAVTVVPPPWDPSHPNVGMYIDEASGSVGGRQLTVAFVGAPDTGDKPCGEDYTTEAVESELAVVVIVYRHPHVNVGGGCLGIGATRTAIVALASPLGNRTVLQVLDGTPVSVQLVP